MGKELDFELPEIPSLGANSTDSLNGSNGYPHQFQYDQLAENQLRLFLLDLNGEDDELSGSLLTLYHRWNSNDPRKSFIQGYKAGTVGTQRVMKHLTGVDHYDTFSYCWRDQTESFPLHLSVISDQALKPEKSYLRSVPQMDFEPHRNGTIQIGYNLKSLLEEMRRRKYRRFLWIDAICIDQASDEEKKMQIPMMADIFTYANDGYVWFGEGSLEEVTAMRLLPHVTENMEKLVKARKNAFAEHQGNEIPRTIMEREGETEFWTVIGDILENPWWSRLWTLQEVVVHINTSGRNVSDLSAMVWLSDTSTELQIFIRLLDALNSLGFDPRDNHKTTAEFLHGPHGINEIRVCRKTWFSEGFGVNLSSLLLGTRGRRATVSVDMVYGMMAMMDSHMRSALSPKEISTVQEVFIKFAKYYIRNEHREQLFSHISTVNRIEGLPSWCPDFSSPPATASLGTQWFGGLEPSLSERRKMLRAGYEIHGKWQLPKVRGYFVKQVINSWRGRNFFNGVHDTDNPRQIALIPDTDHILVSGVQVDVVAETVEFGPIACFHNFSSSENVERIKHWEAQCLQLAMKYMAGDEGKFDTYVRTLCANRVAMRPSQHQPIVYDYEHKMDFLKLYQDFKERLCVSSEKSTASPAMQSREARQFTNVVALVNRGRKFFATEGGRISLGPANLEVGDHVRVVFFCPTPYIFRQCSNGRSRLIGEAYVHGFMYGETLDMLWRQEIDETKWVVE